MVDIQVLTVEELANMLRVDDRTIYRKVSNNEIPGAFRVGDNGAIRFNKDTILQWIRNQSERT